MSAVSLHILHQLQNGSDSYLFCCLCAVGELQSKYFAENDLVFVKVSKLVVRLVQRFTTSRTSGFGLKKKAI